MVIILKLTSIIKERISNWSVIQRRVALFLSLAILTGAVCLVPLFAQKRGKHPLKIAYTSSAVINPFCIDDSARGALSLTHISLSNMTRSGNYVLTGNYSESFNGNTYKYTAPADVTYSYDGEADITTYTIKLRDDLKCSAGSITADDLIFTYYVICDKSYTGTLRAKNADIVGLREYRANNADASKITEQDVADALAKIDENTELQQKITADLIIPTLTRELDEYRRLYDALGRDKFESIYSAENPESLLLGIFAGNADISENDLIPAIAELYDGDFKSFAVSFTGSPSLSDYFLPQAKQIAEEFLIDTLYCHSEKVTAISGINRVDDLTITIAVYGAEKSDLDAILDIYIAPLELYGNSSMYDYAANSFGFSRGNITEIVEKEIIAPAGGAYYFTSRADGITYLNSFEGYYSGKSYVNSIQLVNTALATDENASSIDIVLSEDKPDDQKNYICTEIASRELTYIGINADRVSVYDQDSVYGDRLREAFCVLFSYSLSAAEGSDYFRGNSAPINTAYYKSASYAKSRNEAVAEIQKLISEAGYAFDDEIGKFTVAASGGRLEYEILLTAQYHNDAYIHAALEEARSILAELGLTLTISESASTLTQSAAVMANRHDFFVGAIDTEYISEYLDILSNDEFVKENIFGKNPFNYASEKLAKALRSASNIANDDISELFSAIDGAHIMIPIGQKKTYLYVNSQTVKSSSIPDELTQYYSYVNAIDKIITKK